MSNLTVNFIHLSKKSGLFFNIESCGTLDGAFFISFCGLMWLATVYGIKVNRSEHKLKARFAMGLVQSDLRYTTSNIRPVLTMGLIGGFVGGTVGFGGGSIIKPTLIKQGLPPSVATATSMYITMLSSAVQTVVFFSYGFLNLKFAIWISFWCSVGILVGVRLVNYIIKIYKRQSVLVFMVFGVLSFCSLLVPMQVVYKLWEQN